MKISQLLILLLVPSLALAREYHVSKNGNELNNGSTTNPFLTIKQAVHAALPGDTITVHGGTYREWINPLRGGESDLIRILYRAAPGEKVEIKGSEIIKGWVKVKDGVWKVSLPNSFFGNYNPYRDSVNGDWFIPKGRIYHTGEVFLNGKPLYEMETMGKVLNTEVIPEIKVKEGSDYVWYCETDENNTTIWANFHKFNPNKELVEISKRNTCFYPENPGINFITVRGFHFSQAATQWAAPTAGQVGMIATHWNKGWIIENNVISDSKNNGITLGKERETGHNVWSADVGNINRDGNIHYIEVVFNVLRNNWNKKHIGSHVVRNNTIYNCGQTGICGSMGAVFSIIENNHIYNIWTNRLYAGWEIAGIKFHAPIDVTIRKNRIHDCGRGVWLDWMTQGARVSSNLFYNNDHEDLFVEVNHGPYIADNNILLSPTAISNQSQGGAYVHNLIAGKISVRNEPNRFTPYFLPHSIDMAGLTTIYGGDDRYYNNIITGNDLNPESNNGLEAYNEFKLPAWLDGNVYFNGIKPSGKDVNFVSSPEFDPEIKIVEEGEKVFLQFTVDQICANHKVKLIGTEILGKAKVPKAAFDNPDDSPLNFDKDFSGKKRLAENVTAGPFIDLKPEKMFIAVW